MPRASENIAKHRHLAPPPTLDVTTRLSGQGMCFLEVLGSMQWYWGLHFGPWVSCGP